MKKIETMDTATLDDLASLWSRNDYVKGMAYKDVRRHLQWKYDPAHASVYVERLEGRAIGTCGYIKTVLWTAAGDLECRWGMDTLIDKPLRISNPNIFARVFRPGFRFEYPSRQIILCFPNPVVREAYLKIGMRPIGNLALYHRSSAAPEKKPGEAGLVCSWESSFTDPAIGQLSGRLKGAFSLLSRRDTAFLSWRYDACPGKKYKVLVARRGKVVEGFLVVHFSREDLSKQCNIVDILCHPADRGLMDRMLQEVSVFCGTQGVGNIVIIVNHSAFVAALTDAGYIKEKSVDLFCWVKDKSLYDILEKRHEHLHVTAGDGDYAME